jgi:predicted nucleotidyltransferase
METILAQTAAVAAEDASARHSPRVARCLALLRQEMPELQARYRVRSLGLFGSHVRGEESEASDLDVLVEFDVAPTFFGFIELEDKLSRLLGIKVDLVMKSALWPEIGRRILAEVVGV